MDLFIVSRDGSKQSLVANLALAVWSKQQGQDVVLMYDQEAMIAMAENNFQYTGLLKPYAEDMERIIGGMGFPTDPIANLRMAKAMGVEIVTCQLWAGVARTKNEIPEEIKVVEIDEIFAMIASAEKIMGNF